MTLNLLATDDIPEQSLQRLRDSLRNVDSVSSEGRMCFRSIEAPSWVRLIGEASWWVQLFAGISALYVAELVKEAGKETWKSRARLVSAAINGARKLKELSVALFQFKGQAVDRTEIVVALPEPHEYFGTQLRITGGSAEEIEVELALFLHYLPAFKNLMKSHQDSGDRTATGYFMELSDAGDLHIFWFDHDSLKRCEATISFNSNAI